MANIDIEKFISSLIERSSGITQQIFHSDLLNALKEQGLEYKNGEIVKSQRTIAAEAKEALYSASCVGTINAQGITIPISQFKAIKISEQDELTEFKEEFMAIIDSWCGGNGYVYAQKVKEVVKNDANKLLALARKQILSELPKWRKDNPSATTLYIKYGDYYMEIKELDKIFKMLIKEE